MLTFSLEHRDQVTLVFTGSREKHGWTYLEIRCPLIDVRIWRVLRCFGCIWLALWFVFFHFCIISTFSVLGE